MRKLFLPPSRHQKLVVASECGEKQWGKKKTVCKKNWGWLWLWGQLPNSRTHQTVELPAKGRGRLVPRAERAHCGPVWLWLTGVERVVWPGGRPPLALINFRLNRSAAHPYNEWHALKIEICGLIFITYGSFTRSYFSSFRISRSICLRVVAVCLWYEGLPVQTRIEKLCL